MATVQHNTAATKAAPGGDSVTVPSKKVKLQIVSNPFFLMGKFQKAAQRQGWRPEEIKVVLDECQKTSDDSHHLLRTLIEHTEDPAEAND